MNATDQRGFGTVEMLPIAVIIGLLGFTGYFVWNSQKTTDEVNSDATKVQAATPRKNTVSASKATASDNTQNYLVIKEWGVRFKLPDAVRGTSYSMNETTQSAELQLALLIGTPCEKPGWIGHIYRSTIKTNDAMSADSSIPSSAPTG